MRLSDFLIEYAEAAEQLGEEYKRRQEKQRVPMPQKPSPKRHGRR